MLNLERSSAPSVRPKIRGLVRVLLIGWSLTFVGCASAFVGTWKGECDVGVGSSGVNIPVTMELGDASRDLVSGTGEFEYNDYVFEGAASGRVVDDEAVKIDIEGVAGGYLIVLEIEAEHNAEELEGICGMKDQDTLYEGDITMTLAGSK